VHKLLFFLKHSPPGKTVELLISTNDTEFPFSCDCFQFDLSYASSLNFASEQVKRYPTQHGITVYSPLLLFFFFICIF